MELCVRLYFRHSPGHMGSTRKIRPNTWLLAKADNNAGWT